MSLHVFVFLLVVSLLLSLARLGRLEWLPFQTSSSRGGVKRHTLPRLLKPRSPEDCPSCRLASPASSALVLASVRPWCEVKSRRGALKRIDTEGFACPNRQCPYFSITDAHLHALVGDGKHGRAEPIQTFRCQMCHSTFSARRHTPLYRLKTPSQQVAVVLSALAEGLDPSAAERVAGLPTSDHHDVALARWQARSDVAQAVPSRHLHLPHLPLDELRTRLRCAKQIRLSVAGHRSSHVRFFPCLSSVPARNTWLIASSIPCERAWPQAAFHFSPAMGSICTSTR